MQPDVIARPWPEAEEMLRASGYHPIAIELLPPHPTLHEGRLMVVHVQEAADGLRVYLAREKRERPPRPERKQHA